MKSLIIVVELLRWVYKIKGAKWLIKRIIIIIKNRKIKSVVDVTKNVSSGHHDPTDLSVEKKEIHFVSKV